MRPKHAPAAFSLASKRAVTAPARTCIYAYIEIYTHINKDRHVCIAFSQSRTFKLCLGQQTRRLRSRTRSRELHTALELTRPDTFRPGICSKGFGVHTIIIYYRSVYNLWTVKRSHRWLQDTSKRKLADFFNLFRAPPLPVSPGLPEADPTIGNYKRPGFKKLG